jgi:PD-(D/E)XK endonuclease
MNSTQIGSISEAAVEWDLLGRGFNVLKPSVTTRYDRLVEIDGKYVRVQVKTARTDVRDGNLRISYETPYSDDQIDMIAVFDPNTRNIYYIPINDIPVGAKGFTLRVTERKYNRKKSAGLDAYQYLDFPPKDKGVNENGASNIS